MAEGVVEGAIEGPELFCLLSLLKLGNHPRDEDVDVGVGVVAVAGAAAAPEFKVEFDPLKGACMVCWVLKPERAPSAPARLSIASGKVLPPPDEVAKWEARGAEPAEAGEKCGRW